MEFAKIIRDPIHGFISLTPGEVKIIDTPTFQRLRNIKQLALSNYVFPGAVHTRFEHSLGTLHMTQRILQKLIQNGARLGDEEIRAIRCSALLHDIGHGPFSHVAENFIEFPTEGGAQLGHAKASVDIIRMHEDLEFLGDSREQVATLLSDWMPPRTFIRDIVTGPLDADKMDYLLRDSHFTGVRYGVTDVERIVYTLMEIPDIGDSGRSFLAVSDKGREAVESLVLARYFMHNQVYLHHTRLICDAMISRDVALAVRDGGVDRNLFRYKTDPDYLSDYLSMTDSSLLELLASCGSDHAKRITGELKTRHLFKSVYSADISTFADDRVKSLLSDMTRDEMLKYEREIAEMSDVEPEFVILARQELTKPTYRGTPSKDILDSKTILVQGADGIPRELEKISPIFSAMTQRIRVTISCYSDFDAPTESDRKTKRETIGARAADVLQSIGK